MNKKALIPLVAGLGVGAFALKMVFDTLQKAKGAQVSTVQVWAAKNDIPRGTLIADEMLRSVEFPTTLVPKGAFKDKKELVGRVPRMSAPGSLPILEDMLLPKGSPPGLFVKEGLRAMAVKIDESSGVANMLQPGSRVDVVGFFNVKKDAKQATIARTLVENVEVAAVGQRVTAATESKTGKSDEKPARAVTLFVPPDKVPVLHLAEQRGKIKLSLRNDSESGVGYSGVQAEEADVTGQLDPDAKKSKSSGGNLFSALFGGSKDETTPTLKPKPVVVAAKPKPTWDIYVWHGPTLEIARFEGRDSNKRVLKGNAKGKMGGLDSLLMGGPTGQGGANDAAVGLDLPEDATPAEPEKTVEISGEMDQEAANNPVIPNDPTEYDNDSDAEPKEPLE